MQTFTVVISGEFLRMSLCCTHPAVYNYEEVIKAIKDGQATRSTASTNMNEHSSREH
jgi:hypothetical protein